MKMGTTHVFILNNLIISTLILLAFSHATLSVPSKTSSTLSCAYFVAPSAEIIDNDDQDDGFTEDDNKSNSYVIHQEGDVIECSNLTYCFTVWKTDANGTEIIKRRGCLERVSSLDSCEQRDCIADRVKGLHGDHHFCCCTSDMCNLHVSIVNSSEIPATSAPQQMVPMQTLRIIWESPIVWLCFALTVLMLLAAILICWYGVRKKTEPECAPLAPSGPGYSSNLRNVDNLKLCAMIGQGKYGTVWKGMINEQTVAVKIYPSHHKQFFLNEKDIYSVNLMDSPYLLEYFGSDERRTLDDSIEYLLVLSLAPLGCLQDWLKENTMTFGVFINMARSVTRGLAHLHTELIQSELRKPAICHRDLNSRNVLVKADLTCVVSDFGFAMKTYGPRYEWKGEIILAETKSINEVGTIRYLAPEVLEGAVNLRDCESSMKQVDVYALGLILWELCTRCRDWYSQGQSVPKYSMPYELEVGKNPSYDQLQVLVSRHKARPLFPTGWGDGPAAKIARETCEDCWDHDAEARLTALCADERMHEMSNLPPRSRGYLTSSPPLSTNNQLTSGLITQTDVPLNAAHKSVVGILKSANRQRYAEGTDPAVLNLVSPSSLKNREMLANQIQTFQGRNPCIERNLRPTNISNSAHIDRSQKHSFMPQNAELRLSRFDGDASVEDFISSAIGKRSNAQSILGEGIPNQHNIDRKMAGWYGVRSLIQRKLFKRHPYSLHDDSDEKLSNLDKNGHLTVCVNMEPNSSSSVDAHHSSHRPEPAVRPTNLDIIPKHPHSNRMRDSRKSIEYTRYKTPPGSTDEQFAIVANEGPHIVTSKSATAVRSLNNFEMFDENNLKRQRSLEVFRDVFGTKSSVERLRDPSQRVKTPGDVPPSVRRVRASKTLSLYDDRMMDMSTSGNPL